jgi:hypothetical protein
MGKNRSPYELAVIGHCIYCPSPEAIGVEHIIPESLGGKHYLTAASCISCANKTKEFERVVAREMYRPLKLSLGIRGKRSHRKQQPTHWPVEHDDGGAVERTQVEIGKLPKLYLAAEMVPLAFMEHLGTGKLETIHDFKWGPFCQMLAKAAHAYTIGVLGFGGLDFLLPPLILGHEQYLAYLIGGIGEATTTPTPELELRTVWIGRTLFVAARISLFGGRLPTYQVVSAEVRDLDLIAPKIRAATVR